MNLKKTIIAVATCVLTIAVMMLIMTGCKEAQDQPPVDPHAHITADKVYELCKDPAEFHQITRLGFPMEALVVRHSDCLGIDDMFMVIWHDTDSEKNKVGAYLLVLMYIEYQNDINPTEKMTASLIKIDKINSGKSKTHMAIYSLKKEKIELEKNSTGG